METNWQLKHPSNLEQLVSHKDPRASWMMENPQVGLSMDGTNQKLLAQG
jgi:hypothetical protein